MSYKVVRMYFNDHKRDRVVKRGLTLKEAQTHCRNPQTSSSTCTSPEAVARTNRCGPWFDGYSKE